MHGMDPWILTIDISTIVSPPRYLHHNRRSITESEVEDGGWHLVTDRRCSHPPILLYWGLHTWTLPLGRRMLPLHSLQVAFILLDNYIICRLGFDSTWAKNTRWQWVPSSVCSACCRPGLMPRLPGMRTRATILLKINGWGFHIGVVTTSHIRTRHPRTFRGHFRDIQPFIPMPNYCSI